MHVDEVVNIHEAKTHFSRLLRDIEAGRRIAIARNGQPVALLTGIDDPLSVVERRLGAVIGEVSISRDFDETPVDFAGYLPPES